MIDEISYSLLNKIRGGTCVCKCIVENGAAGSTVFNMGSGQQVTLTSSAIFLFGTVSCKAECKESCQKSPISGQIFTCI